MNRTSFASVERKTIVYGIIISMLVIYAIRLFTLQIIETERFDLKSSDNSIKAIEQPPLRGVFYDRNFKLLIENMPAYTVRITPSEYDTVNNAMIESALGLNHGFIKNLLERNKTYSKYIPLKVKRGADFFSIGWIEENKEHLPGVDYIIEMQRNYPANVMGSHVFGYSKEISSSQLKKEDDYYKPGDIIGYSGLEKKYEKDIRGVKGYNYILVDSRRREVDKFNGGDNDVPSIKGADLVLGLDLDLMRIAEEELEGKSGAVVAIDPKTGEVLCMVSKPDYDLNKFSYVTPREYLNELIKNPLKPQFNRATMAAHPPGSTFKLLMAIAALELGIINENTTLFCGGGFTFGRFFKCHGADGSINVVRAIEKSCNTFFYQLSLKIGLKNLHEFAKRFNLGRKTGIDIAEESPGLIPNEAYYEKIYGKNWPLGIVVSLGIGQGEISVTPLQLAFFTALVANNGSSYVPHLVKGYLDNDKEFHPITFEKVETGVSQKTFDIVKKGMFDVVQGYGTGRSIRIPGVNISGKTGTAQNPHGKDHAWFTCFAPSEDPQIAIAVLVENVGFGATHAAPIAKKLIESYLKDYISNNLKKNITQSPTTINEENINAN